ncbi:hypothetical protein DQ04_00411080 [Trypanosoma grayi]|uniref:hypothetical protein n=1 Tax=Trypanosoma grayi TaxID=71804 RepID=UPI0004F450A5|nr:hypothetical protein DQ04_00411080 [Trypanosoma grayi]KEG14544.1 hypothetical protein DQ04_00411080 [Trypanosoma grayi]
MLLTPLLTQHYMTCMHPLQLSLADPCPSVSPAKEAVACPLSWTVGADTGRDTSPGHQQRHDAKAFCAHDTSRLSFAVTLARDQVIPG